MARAARVSPDMIDHARRLLGRLQYPSAVKARLMQAHRIGDARAREAIRAAQDQAYAGMRGDDASGDPLVGCALFYQAIMAGEDERTCDRLQAAHGLVRLLGLKRLTDRLGAGDVDELLAAIAARTQARPAVAAPAEGP